jgi:hypothetical protein
MNLRGWEILRKVCYEYGELYFIRVQVLKGMMIVIILGGLVIVTLGVFGNFTVEKPFMIMATFDGIVLITLIIFML